MIQQPGGSYHQSQVKELFVSQMLYSVSLDGQTTLSLDSDDNFHSGC